MFHKTLRFITLIFLLALSNSITQAAESAPRLIVPETVDVGQVKQSQTVERSLILENTGGKALTISSLTTDCPCTTLYRKNGDQFQDINANLSLTILPHSRLEVKMVFDANKTKYVGPIKKFIVIESDDPERPVVRIRLSGEIVKS